MRKIIVTGGCGFVGSHLVDRLVTERNQVVVIDDLSTGRIGNINQKSKGKFRFIQSNLGNFHNWDSIPEELNEAEFLVHLAALPRIGLSVGNPIRTHIANVDGTIQALELARRLKVGKFIFSSSSSIYGMQKELPMRESMIPNPQNPYAVQKLIGEEYCKLYRKVFGLNTLILRFFNIYGPRMATVGEYKLVFTNWIEEIKAKKSLTIYGDGNQTRDFTHVFDAVDGLIKAIEASTNDIADPINVCTGIETTVNKLARLFGRKTKYVSPRPNEEKRKYGDNGKALRYLGWKPKISLEEGIKMLKKEYSI